MRLLFPTLVAAFALMLPPAGASAQGVAAGANTDPTNTPPQLLTAVDNYQRGSNTVARRQFELAAHAGHPLSQFWLARLRYRGRIGFEQEREGTQKTAHELFPRIMSLGKSGNDEAQFLLGSAYDDGFGTGANPAESIRWYRASADRGHCIAMLNLGLAYADGTGVARNYQEAIRLFQGASAEEPGGYYWEGFFCHWGLGVAPDLDKAKVLYEKALALGYSRGKDSLAKLALRPAMKHTVRDEALLTHPLVCMLGLQDTTILRRLDRVAVSNGMLHGSIIMNKERAPLCVDLTNGVMFEFNFGSANVVDMYAGGVNQYEQSFGAYTGTLPLGLKWGETSSDVRNRLGDPDDGGYVPDQPYDGMAYFAGDLVLVTLFDRKPPNLLQAVRIYARWPPNARQPASSQEDYN